MTREINLTQGLVALISDEDYEKVAMYKWHATKRRRTFYAEGVINGRNVLLHRFIMNAPSSVDVDHEDGDGLNCQRYNIRLATASQNAHNRAKNENNTSGYKGVSFDKSRGSGKWRVQIRINNSNKFLGAFDDPVEAAHAYDNAAIKYFGDFANLNFPDDKT